MYTELEHSPAVHIMRGGEGKKGVRVVTAQAYAKGKLKLVPLVQGVSRIATRGGDGALEARISHNDKRATYYILGSAPLPPTPTPTMIEDALAAAPTPEVLPAALTPAQQSSSPEELEEPPLNQQAKPSAAEAASAIAESLDPSSTSCHEWKNSNFPWPFWQVRREATQSVCNCGFEEWIFRSVCTMSISEQAPLADAWDVMIPIITNTEDLVKGQELVVHWPMPSQAKTTKNKKATTWVDVASRASKKSRRQ